MDSKSTSSIVSIRQIEKRFPGREAPVLRALSLEVPASQLTLVMGRSGSGKSTLLHCVAGLERIDAGEIVLGGESLSRMNIEQLAALRLRKIGIVFQFFNLLGSLTLEQNILLPVHLAGKPSREFLGYVLETAEELKIGNILKKYPHEVSGGEAQRAAIARALVLRPSLILADEPTGNLDVESAEMVFELFRNLTRERGVSVLLVSHDPSFVTKSDHVFDIEHLGTQE
ncbi:MAG: ABC transporter ATP-binding protein [Bdellovibrionales bacterium]|nr:ABC transporter ATP-binding protein [Bdellovibrionales bacterium]